MNVSVGGLDCVIEADDGLSDDEMELLADLDRGGMDADGQPHRRPPFRLETIGPPPDWSIRAVPSGEPARIIAGGDRIHVDHADFQASVDPVSRRGRIHRSVTARHPLEITLRIALCSVLPLDGGLPLHAAGVTADGAGLVFVGPSGAGKSTLARSAPYPVFSDELVIVRGRPPRVMASGFWGQEERADRPCAERLLGIFELGKGSRTSISRLEPANAVRRLLSVVLVPALPRLWRDVVALVAGLAHEVPFYHLEWNPAESPWKDIVETACIDRPVAGIEAPRCEPRDSVTGGVR